MSFSNQGFGGVFDVSSINNAPKSPTIPEDFIDTNYDYNQSNSPRNEPKLTLPPVRSSGIESIDPELFNDIINKIGEIKEFEETNLEDNKQQEGDVQIPSQETQTDTNQTDTPSQQIKSLNSSPNYTQKTFEAIQKLQQQEKEAIDQVLKEEISRINENYRIKSLKLDEKLQQIQEMQEIQQIQQIKQMERLREDSVSPLSPLEAKSIDYSSIQYSDLGGPASFSSSNMINSQLQFQARHFYFGNSRTPILFKNWQPTSYRSTFGSCVAIFLITMLLFLLISIKQALQAKFPTHHNGPKRCRNQK